MQALYSPVTNWKASTLNKKRQQNIFVEVSEKVDDFEEITPRRPISPTIQRTQGHPACPRSELSPRDPSTPRMPITPTRTPGASLSPKSPNPSNDDCSFPKRSQSLATQGKSPKPSRKKSHKSHKSSHHHHNKSVNTPKANTQTCNSMKRNVNLPKINTTNLSCHKSSIESATAVDSANSEYSTYLSSNRKSEKVRTPLSSTSSCSTAYLSPSMTNTSLSTTRESDTSMATMCQSPTSATDNNNYLNMNNDQLFSLLPKKIIKALDTYTAQNSNEITYSKGDFFFVVSEDDKYYFVTDPSTKKSGYVLKYSFEQVDHFSIPINVRTNSINNNTNSVLLIDQLIDTHLEEDARQKEKQSQSQSQSKSQSHSNSNSLSPIPEKKEATSGAVKKEEQVSISDRIMTACITEDLVTRNTQEKFQIEITKIDGTVAVLNRCYDDIYDFHQYLLDYFPDDAGNNKYERILPFLPSHDTLYNHPNKSPRQILNHYLQMVTRLPNDIQFSTPFKHFFGLRNDDILSSLKMVKQLNFFNGTLTRKNEHQPIRVKIVVEDERTGEPEINMIRIDPMMDYFDLFDMLESRFNRQFSNMYFKNENGEMAKIFGNPDLHLFLNSYNLTFVIYAK